MNNLIKLAVVGGALIGVGLFGLGACASTVTPKSRQHPDSEITSVIRASLDANGEEKARQVAVETRDGVVYLTGVVESEDARREAGRLGWNTEGVGRVSNEILVGTIGSEPRGTGGL